MANLVDVALAAFPSLSREERQVVTAASRGDDVVFAPRAPVRPEVIRWLCADPDAKALVDPRGIRITNAEITGTLELQNVDVEFYLRLHRCTVSGDIDLNDARCRSIGLNGSDCRRLLAWRAVVAGSVFLTKDGDLPFRAEEVWLGDSSVSGVVDLGSADLGPAAAGNLALCLDRATVKGILLLEGTRLRGAFWAYDAALGGIQAQGARFESPSQDATTRAVELVRTTVAGDADFAHSLDGPATTATGPVVVFGARVGGSLNLVGMQFVAGTPGAPGARGASAAVAEAATQAQDREEDAGVLPDLLDLRLTKVDGHLSLDKAIVDHGSLTIWDSVVGQDLVLTQFHDRDQGADDRVVRVRVLTTRIGRGLYWEPLLPEDSHVQLDGSETGRLVHSGITYWPERGVVRIGGFRYRTIDGPTLYKRQWLAEPSRRIRAVDAEHRSWILRLALRWSDLAAGADATQLSWVRLHTRQAFEVEPYDVLVAALRAKGQDADAVRVLIARSNDRRRARGVLSVALGLPYLALVANGFRTWLAGLWAVVFTLVGSAVFGDAYRQGELVATDGQGVHLPFHALMYSLDTLLPIVDLGEADAFLPAGTASVRAYYWFQILLGWVLATAIAASAAAFVERRR